ncbi:MAG TPA: GNAT family N-acetyltransferase [Actinomycetota bacterium]|nr:GNAT family N-acetyltransferase [Actinomycetota bacterium]
MTPEDRFIVSSDPAVIDTEAAVDFLSHGVPWGRWRTPEQIRSQVEGAWRVAGVVERDTRQLVAFARAVSDGVMIAYLADVYVLPEYRGLGLSTRLLTELIDDGPGKKFRWMLHTDDAHGLYRRFGFREPSATYLERSGPPS